MSNYKLQEKNDVVTDYAEQKELKKIIVIS